MVLGIRNRTENWKTAHCFAPLFGVGAVCLAQRLAPDRRWDAAQLKLELYWKGMRDHFAERVAGQEAKEAEKRKIQGLYTKRFGRLRDDVERYAHSKRFQALKRWNYDGTKTEELFNNLYNTEIDVVLETPEHLFIGEAKHETGFHANSSLVLVHQLIRQYVMATVLVNLRNDPRTVVPFLVTDVQLGQGKRRLPNQVQFLLERKWLTKNRMLTWCDIKSLASR